MSVNKYKVGDKVKIRTDLIIGNDYGNHVFCEEMSNYVGSTTTIAKRLSGTYYLALDPNEYHWTDEMLEPEHKHQWQFVEKTSYGGLSGKIHYRFVCECGDYKIVDQGKMVEEK